MSRPPKIRVLHFINQFFAGVGGEDKADHPVDHKDTAVGPGLLLQKILGVQGEVVGTIFCGDGYFVGNQAAATAAVMEHIQRLAPDLVVAGPAFNSGRYGLACASVCKAAQGVGIPAITAMHPENPGVSAGRKDLHIIPTGETAALMEDALEGMVRLGMKMARNEPIGAAADEGYIPTGARYNEVSEIPTAQRAVDMLLNKIQGKPFESELIVPRLDKVEPPPPIGDLRSAIIAVVSEGGMVPPDNPHRIPGARASNWAKYSFKGKKELPKGSFVSIHGGFNTVFVNESPDRMLAIDALRELEKEGYFLKLHDDFLSTCGNGGAFEIMQEIGRAWAREIKSAGVTGVILPAT